MIYQLNGCPRFLFFFLIPLFLSRLWSVDYVLSMWGKIMMPMYRLWLHGLYGLYGPLWPLSPERPLNLINHSINDTNQWKFVQGIHRCYYRASVDSHHKKSIMRNFHVTFVFVLNKLLNKQTSCRWFETQGRSCRVTVLLRYFEVSWKITFVFQLKFHKSYSWWSKRLSQQCKPRWSKLEKYIWSPRLVLKLPRIKLIYTNRWFWHVC